MRSAHVASAALIRILSLTVVLLCGPASAAPIGGLHCNQPDGTPRMKGQAVTIAGVVVGQFSTPRNVRLFVEDATGAVCVFGSPKNCVPVGDSVRVTGVVGVYSGLTEVTGTSEKPVELVTLGHASWRPSPLALTLEQANGTETSDGCEPNESRLVRVDGVRILSAAGEALAAGAKFGDDTNYRLVRADADTTVFLTMRVVDAEGCDLSSSLEDQPIPVGVTVSVAGILSQYARGSQSHGGYQILPRGRDDIRVVTAKPAADRH